MNELRWILLVAGVLLIAGLYLWGMRSRWQGRGETEASRRPAVFTGGAKGFETEAAAPLDDDDDDIDAGEPEFRADARVERRIEPSFDADDVAALDAPESRRVEFDDESDFESPAIGRREPTLSSTRTETAPTAAAGTDVARRTHAGRVPRRAISSPRLPRPAQHRHRVARRRSSRSA